MENNKTNAQTIYKFAEITKDHSHLGGKGFALGLMKNGGFPVPDGLILTELPSKELEWTEILSWWKALGSPKLAVRSSAVGEDSSETSFAGQNSTFLNVDTESGLKKAVENCFQSMYKKSSSIYREHFLGEKASDAKMNVVVQEMVDPKYSGVFFSVDPRNNQHGWIAEAIEGLGEDLVSGKKTPHHFEEKKICTTNLFNLQELVKTGMSVRDFFGLEIDMEWSVDQKGHLKVLQARPITALSGKSEEKRLIDEEIKRLKSTHSADTIWDGNTFAEWSGPPSELTFSVWSEAFSKQHAFSKALRKLGYLGIENELTNETHSLLEKIFDRAYVNISMLAPLYFGPIPYRLEYDHSPKLKFDFHKMNFKTFVLTPMTMARMVGVSFRLSTERRKWLSECAKELALFHDKSFRVKDVTYYRNHTDEKLIASFKREVENFYDQHLVWPLVLVSLIESTTQSLKALMKGVLPDNEIEKTMNHWLGIGLHTVTMDMNLNYSEASMDENRRSDFMAKYGHRGPGELELANPRWQELGDKTFFKMTSKEKKQHIEGEISVEKEIQALNTYKKQVIEKEWALLREMLELRENWKMNLLSPYSHIRYSALEIARRNNMGYDIFWLNFKEILSGDFDLKKAQSRKSKAMMSKSIYLPSIVDLKGLEAILENKSESTNNTLVGESLSPGLVFGEIRVVTDPEKADVESWPENTVLVAESTDPGWTGLFLKSKAVIVEKGGVLSHCAIVAREMNLPAISGIKQCHLRFKNGDKIWVDGNNGRVTLAKS
jgi:phosphohistidine swiveling domain-containing protein